MNVLRSVVLLAVAFGTAPSATLAADKPLTRAEVERDIIGRRLTHFVSPQTQTTFVYSPDGRFVSVNKGAPTAMSGRYRFEPDGRVCWSGVVKGCFRYYRQGSTIRVRRQDAVSHAEIGVVRFDR